MSLVVTVDASNPELSVIRQVAEMIDDGLVVAYPTDTLYGLAVDPRNGAAVRRLFELKGRPETSALTLIAADAAQARLAGDLTRSADRLAERWWPGPLTIVMRARGGLARETLAGGTTVGIRVPDQAVARALAAAVGFCITATSANRSGEVPASDARTVADALPGVDAILDGGPSRGGLPSTIVNAAGDEVTLIRAGAVPWERVLRSLSSGA